MARALPQGRPIHRRALFGLLDSDGWGWATVKAVIWLLIMILILGYIPDRAYYFVVSRTIELGLLRFGSPVNLCPPENGAGMPCPVPAGGVLPWQTSPSEVALPAARTQGSAAQIGKNLLYIGGSDGKAPTATTYVAAIDNGTYAKWADGPALPAARADAAIANLSGTAYLIGGLGPDGKPTNTVWALGADPDTSALKTWAPAQDASKKDITLPEARSGAAAVAVTDGIVVAGGYGPDGKPTTTVWKATVDSTGNLGAFKEQPALLHAAADASFEFDGTYLWLYGGTDTNGPSGAVQRGAIGSGAAPASSGAPVGSAQPAAGPSQGAAASPSASGATATSISAWADSNSSGGAISNLPGARTGAAGFFSNGALYAVGGSDGSAAHTELYWALPDSSGNLPGGWRHLDKTDLPAGIVGGAPIVAGTTAIVIGGSNAAAATGAGSTGAVRTSLAPQQPFFQLGFVGVVVPALQIGGEIGQQLGYLAAAGVGTGNFVILVIIGWAFNHRPQIREWWERRKAERAAKAST